MITREFNLYLHAGHSIPLVINVNQYDQGEQWLFTLFNADGTQYVPSSGAIVGIKSDNLGIINSGTVDSQGRVVINETQQMTASVGKAVFELLIDDQTHGTANFVVLVEEKPGNNADLSESDISMIEEAIEAASTIKPYGSPLVASTVAGMTDHEKVYVYVGSETGYTSGNWYYWDGTAWTSGGVYNSVAVQTDTTLALSGVAADAKKVGDEISDLKSQIEQIDGGGGGGSDTTSFSGKIVLATGDSITENNSRNDNKSWCMYLPELLGVTVYNDGKSGTGIVKSYNSYHSMLYRVENNWNTSYAGITPNIVLIMGNMNDGVDTGSTGTLNDLGVTGWASTGHLAVGTPTDDINTQSVYGCVKRLLEDIIAKYPLAKIGWILSTPRRRSLSYWTGKENMYGHGWFEDYITAIRYQCEQYNVPVLDLYHESQFRPTSETNMNAYMDDGTTHPNTAGIQKYMVKPIVNWLKLYFDDVSDGSDEGGGEGGGDDPTPTPTEPVTATDETAYTSSISIANSDFTSGYKIDSTTGLSVADSTTSISKYYNISAMGNTLSITLSASKAIRVAFYNSSKELISNDGYASVTNKDVSIPSNAHYFRMAVSNLGTASVTLTAVTVLESGTLTSSDMRANTSLSPDGTESTYTGIYTSNPVQIPTGATTFKIDSYRSSTSQKLRVAFYDSSDACTGANSSQITTATYTATIPSGSTYLKVCVFSYAKVDVVYRFFQ